jgi:hypothetical protein
MFRHPHLRSCLLATGLAAAVIGVGSGTASAHNSHPEMEAHPYHAVATLTGHLDFNLPSVSLTGTGRAPYMGRATTVQTITQAGGNSVTITSAKGEMLHLVPVALLDPSGVVCPAGSDPIKSTWAFAGGTGRFTHATGTVTVAGCATDVFVSPGVVDETVTFHADGTIVFADNADGHGHGH